MAPETSNDAEKIAELNAIVQAVRDRVRARYPEPGETEGSGNGASGRPRPRVRVHLADLMAAVHARDAAMAKVAAIGSVNPRAGGPVNRAIQRIKKLIARGLEWFVRDQITFNREAVTAVETLIEALNEHNRALVSLAGQANEQIDWLWSAIEARTGELRSAHDVRGAELFAALEARSGELYAAFEARSFETDRHFARLEPEVEELKDIRKHFAELRSDWDQKVAWNEIQFLRSVADLQGAFQHRVTQMESNFREIAQAQHKDYLGALDRTTGNIQKQVWIDFQKVRAEYGQMIHDELRIIRLRQKTAEPQPPISPAAASMPGPGVFSGLAPAPPEFDYTRFAFRFRGPEEHVRRTEEFYRPFFADCRNVLDIGCGRGEFLELLRDMGVPAKGIDLQDESIAQCREKGLNAEIADLFTCLGPATAGEFDGIFASQIVEHIEPGSLPRMIRLCASSLRRGGVLAIETPNPDCLAIFATYFYLDPTHTRPVPRQLLEFYMEECGIGAIEVHELSPAEESIPEIGELPERFRKRFFGGLDYAIVGRKL